MRSLFIGGAAIALAAVASVLSLSDCPSPICRTTPTGSAGFEVLPQEVDDRIEPVEDEPPRLLDWDEADPIDLIAVCEQDPWLLAVATPIVARLAGEGGKPFLVVASTRPLSKTPLVKGLSIRRCLALASAPGEEILPGEFDKAVAAIKAGKDINYQGASGNHEFDAAGDVPGVIVEMAIKDGQFVEVGVLQ